MVLRCFANKANKANNVKNIMGITCKQKNLFLAKMDKLFDFLVCQCKFVTCDDVKCSEDICDSVHISCDCLRKFKIPEMELEFVRDQRQKSGLQGHILMMSVDKEEVERLNKQERRKPKTKQMNTEDSEDREPMTLNEENYDDYENPNLDPDFSVNEPRNREKDNLHHNQNRINLDDFVAEVMRYGISDRAAAALHNSTLRTHNIIKDGNDKFAVDKNKIRRSRESYAAKQKANQVKVVEDSGGLQCLGADGKRNQKTRKRVVQIINGEEVEKTVVGPQEHIVYTIEPEGEYLCHSEIPHGKGDGRGLADDFLDVIAEHKCNNSLVAVVADGTATNTGWKNGFMAHLERDLQRNLLWLICMAHGNELPLRHLFDHLDGGYGTSGLPASRGHLERHVQEIFTLKMLCNLKLFLHQCQPWGIRYGRTCQETSRSCTDILRPLRQVL